MAEKISIPNQLPILPVRDTVLFPGAVLPLTVGRESSLALINSLQGEDKVLGVVAQHDPRVEDPAAADLHKVGTFAKVHKTVKMPNGNVVIFLEGLQRFQITDLLGLKPFLTAQVEPMPDILGCIAMHPICSATWWDIRPSYRMTCNRLRQTSTIQDGWRTL